MPLQNAQAANFVSRIRAAARLAKTLRDELSSLADVYSAQQIATLLTVDHLTGDNAGLDLAEIQAAILALGAINANLVLDPPGAEASILTKILKIV